MRRQYDYFWARQAVLLTFGMMLPSAFGHPIKPGFEWFPLACVGAFLAASAWAVTLVVLNARKKREGNR